MQRVERRRSGGRADGGGSSAQAVARRRQPCGCSLYRSTTISIDFDGRAVLAELADVFVAFALGELAPAALHRQRKEFSLVVCARPRRWNRRVNSWADSTQFCALPQSRRTLASTASSARRHASLPRVRIEEPPRIEGERPMTPATVRMRTCLRHNEVIQREGMRSLAFLASRAQAKSCVPVGDVSRLDALHVLEHALRSTMRSSTTRNLEIGSSVMVPPPRSALAGR